MVSHRLLHLLLRALFSTSEQNHMHQLGINGKLAQFTFHLHMLTEDNGIRCLLQSERLCYSNKLLIAFTGVFTLCCWRNLDLNCLYSCICAESWGLITFSRWICECPFVLAIYTVHAADWPDKKHIKTSCIGKKKQEMYICVLMLHHVLLLGNACAVLVKDF